MPEASAKPYTFAHCPHDDGSVTFQCSQDAGAWPWLALDPHDPIVVQTINYWTSVECGAARGTYDPSIWSALVWMDWTCGAQGVGHATYGTYETVGDEGDSRFQMTFLDAEDALVYRISGKGVVFHTRDFEGWRAKAKAALAEQLPAGDFTYAPHAETGMPSQWQSFLSPLTQGDTPSARALITLENGLPPAHPYLSGSGDHVNSTHLADVARQFSQALYGGKPLSIAGGEMTFARYVELDRPFDIALAEEVQSDGQLAMNVSQAGNLCSAITLRFR